MTEASRPWDYSMAKHLFYLHLS